MEVYTQAWLLSSIKYSESAAILKLYSQQKGFISLIWKGAYSSKNKQKYLLSPLNEVEVHFRQKNEESLSLLKKIEAPEGRILHPLNIPKNSLLLFLSEVLQSLLINEPENENLYGFLSQEMQQFYTNSHTPLWCQYFLLNISSFLGCMPNENYEKGQSFDLELGGFIDGVSPVSLPINESEIWANFLQGKLNTRGASQRLLLLEILLKYFEIQIPHFRFPKSMEVLKEVFA